MIAFQNGWCSWILRGLADKGFISQTKGLASLAQAGMAGQTLAVQATPGPGLAWAGPAGQTLASASHPWANGLVLAGILKPFCLQTGSPEQDVKMI
jgi:hypothetical protein